MWLYGKKNYLKMTNYISDIILINFTFNIILKRKKKGKKERGMFHVWTGQE